MKKTTKILFVILFSVVVVMSILAAKNLYGLNFGKINYKLDDNKIQNIKHLIVTGSISLRINEENKTDRPDNFSKANNRNLGFIQKGDTLFIYRKNAAAIAYCNIDNCKNLSHIEAKDEASVHIGYLEVENPVIEAVNSSVILHTGRILPGLKLIGKERASFYIAKYSNIINVDLSGKTTLQGPLEGAKIKGIIRNKSIIEFYNNYCNVDELVKKDSAAVIYR